jgi:carboxylate-amine ligase
MGNINYKHFTLGVEEEYMVMDPQSRELTSHEQKIVIEGQKIIKDKVKAEMHQAVVEVGTDICRDIDEAAGDVANLRRTISSIADGLGFRMGAAGTHPFSHWQSQLITDHVRYQEIVNEMQEAARSNLIFGLHVHVGMPSKEMAIHIANSARYFLPHVYALSTNSPFGSGGIRASNPTAQRSSTSSPGPGSPIISTATAPTRTMSTSSSRRIASTMRRRSGGTSACIHSSARWSSASATSR